jgi:hypothetical protein
MEVILLAGFKREQRSGPLLSEIFARRLRFPVNELEFYCLCPPLILRAQPETRPVYGRPDWETSFGAADVKDIDYESITCSLVPGHRRAGARIGDLHLLTSKHIGDFIWTYMSECVVTDTVARLFSREKPTGYQLRNASIVTTENSQTKDKDSVPRVWELDVQEKGGNADPDSGIRLLYVCSECGFTAYSSFQKGIIVDESQWDRTDFFTVNGYQRHIIITERVKDLIIRNKLTNCAIFRSQDLRWGNLPRPEERPELFIAKQARL